MAQKDDGDSKGGSAKGGGHDKPGLYAFFIGKVRYETDQPQLTGAQIKARAPDVEPGDGLSLEGHGNEPDRLIDDSELVDLRTEHGPPRFTIVPRANFG